MIFLLDCKCSGLTCCLNDCTTNVFLFHVLLFLLATQVWRNDCVLVWKGVTCTQRRWEPFTLWRRIASSSQFLPLSPEMFRNSAECWYRALWRRISLLRSLLFLLEYFYSCPAQGQHLLDVGNVRVVWFIHNHFTSLWPLLCPQVVT